MIDVGRERRVFVLLASQGDMTMWRQIQDEISKVPLCTELYHVMPETHIKIPFQCFLTKCKFPHYLPNLVFLRVPLFLFFNTVRFHCKFWYSLISSTHQTHFYSGFLLSLRDILHSCQEYLCLAKLTFSTQYLWS